jgi:hypothetical protein
MKSQFYEVNDGIFKNFASKLVAVLKDHIVSEELNPGYLPMHLFSFF